MAEEKKQAEIIYVGYQIDLGGRRFKTLVDGLKPYLTEKLVDRLQQKGIIMAVMHKGEQGQMQRWYEKRKMNSGERGKGFIQGLFFRQNLNSVVVKVQFGQDVIGYPSGTSGRADGYVTLCHNDNIPLWKVKLMVLRGDFGKEIKIQNPIPILYKTIKR